MNCRMKGLQHLSAFPPKTFGISKVHVGRFLTCSKFCFLLETILRLPSPRGILRKAEIVDRYQMRLFSGEFIFILPRLSYVCPDSAHIRATYLAFCPKGQYPDILSIVSGFCPYRDIAPLVCPDFAKDLGKIRDMILMIYPDSAPIWQMPPWGICQICHRDISGFCP